MAKEEIQTPDKGTESEENTEKNPEESKPAEVKKTDAADYASKSEEASTEKSEIDYRKKFTESQKEALRLKEYENRIKYLDELAEKNPRILEEIESAKIGRVNPIPKPTSYGKQVETPAIGRPSNSKNQYEKYLEKRMKSDWSQATKKVESEFSDVMSDSKARYKMLQYTKRNVMQTPEGLLVNPHTKDPLAPEEYEDILREGAILAKSDKYSPTIREAQERESQISQKLNESATSSAVSTSSKGSTKTVSLSEEEMMILNKMGATEEEITKYAKELKERRKK